MLDRVARADAVIAEGAWPVASASLMSNGNGKRERSVRYQPDERPPGGVVLGCGVQLVVLGITGLVAFPTIVIRAAGETEAYLSWAVFCTVAVSGIATMLQASRLGRIGAGYVLTTGPAAAFIGICVTALVEGGPGLLAVLVIVSSLLPLAVSARLSLFRRFLTPTIVGTVNMLIPATVLPVVFGRLTDVPPDVPELAAPIAMPTQTTTVSVPTIEITGVGARSVGVAAGAVMIALAFLPKALAVVLAVPGPVYAAYLIVLLALIFVRGMAEVVQGGIDHHKGLIAGLGFWAGVGCQNGMIFPEYLAGVAGGLLANGITVGGLVAILTTLFLEVTAPRVDRLELEADTSALPRIREFIGAFAARHGWDSSMVERIEAASEETLLTLVGEDGGEQAAQRRLFLSARKEADGAVLEFVAGTAAGHRNIQDRIGLLAERPDDALMEREVSLRLLRHIASSVRHQQFHDTDILTVRVDAPDAVRGGR